MPMETQSVLPLLVTPLVVFLIFLSTHWIPFRLRAIKKRTGVMTLIMFVCALGIVPTYQFVSHSIPPLSPIVETLIATVFAGVLFTLLWCAYVQFYFSFDTSPSLRFLVEFLQSGKKNLTPSELKMRFDFSDTYRRRIQRAVDGKALLTYEREQGLYFKNSKTALFWANVGTRVKALMGLGEGG